MPVQKNGVKYNKKAVFDEPELEEAWNKVIELSRKHKTKFRY